MPSSEHDLNTLPASENAEHFKAALNGFLVGVRKTLIAAMLVAVAHRTLHGQGALIYLCFTHLLRP